MIKKLKACDNCQACQYIKLDNQTQAKQKELYIRKLYQKSKFKNIDQIILADEPYHYRYKNQVALSSENKFTMGNYQPKSKKVVAVKGCLINHSVADEIFTFLEQLAIKYKLKPYDNHKQQGLLKHFFIRIGYQSQEILIVIVLAKDFFPKKREFIQELITKYPNIKSIVLNINTRKDALVLAKQERVIYGSGKIMDQMAEFKFILSANSFYQVNPAQAIKLYNKAIELANLSKTDRVLDAYCGIGTITSFIAKQVKEVVGVEINKQAISDAKASQKINQLNNIKFYHQDAIDYLKKDSDFDIIFVDPPRSGLSKDFIDALIKAQVKKIVYIACDPDTQYRDIQQLSKANYQLKQLIPVD
ncbi:MAG: 23S rRNA (uracil(1939)-C(5))-methyltransferase RlmD, partial [Erysipelotrichaceae bacterium]